ncbi:Hypothetical predicted protein [Olea europaea subsp. europaea]|uniref:Bifunctional inhibitor/plant lipid transfer protein/seed storage helical domain-containing protein n=1 Tax=Olea europaea subsp. europaea TaxID=158383 RepID=A0A8S0V9S8_OLEEU|nr:Hypothetical predicted protein [Olea europaea subsp. europaea]
MSSQTPAKATLFLAMNVLCFVLTTARGERTCDNPSPPVTDGGPGRGQSATCPRDALKLGVYANLLGGLVEVVVGSPSTTFCCTLLAGLADLKAGVCLCTAIRANMLGINLNIPISLNLFLNVCGRTPPTGFTCA